MINAYLWRKWEESTIEIGRSLRISIVSTWLVIWLVLNKFTKVDDPPLKERWWVQPGACLWKDPGRTWKFHVFVCLFIFVFFLRSLWWF